MRSLLILIHSGSKQNALAAKTMGAPQRADLRKIRRLSFITKHYQSLLEGQWPPSLNLLSQQAIEFAMIRLSGSKLWDFMDELHLAWRRDVRQSLCLDRGPHFIQR